jgi:hypothetical protein
MSKAHKLSSLKQNMPLRIKVLWDVIMAQLFTTFQRNKRLCLEGVREPKDGLLKVKALCFRRMSQGSF